MGNLKEDLKSATSLLKAGDNLQVIELLQEHAENDSPDYRVLCYVALAYSNTGDYENSYQMYKKAVEIDETNPMAWKGLFKLFESKSLAKPDQFALRICEFMQKNGDDKREAAIEASRRLHVELQMWPEILKNFDLFHNAAENLLKMIEILQNNTAQQPLLEKVFAVLKKTGELEKNAKIWLIYSKQLKAGNSLPELVKLVEKFPETAKEEWVQKRLFEHVCKEYFERETFPDVVKHVSSPSSSTMDVLTALKDNDTASALEALDNVPDKTVYPESLLFIRLLAESENWETVEKVVQSIVKIDNSPMLTGWLARALLEIDPDDKNKLAAFGPLPVPAFAVEDMKIALILDNQPRVQELFSQFDEHCDDGIVIRLLQALRTSVTAEHVQLADKLPQNTPQELVLVAEVKLKAGLDANALLVKAAKLNVRCSRAFFLLGKALSVKNATKAKSLIERAVNIRPGCEEYVQALDELLVRKNAATADRLKVLKALLARRRRRQKPFWLADALSIIYLESDSLTEAIDELQQMVRLYKDHKSTWARLADAYSRKGHLRAAVSSYEQLAEMEGGHEFTISMIRVLFQLREFEPALAKVHEYREKIGEENLQSCDDSPIVLNFTEAEIRLNLHETTCGVTRKTHLKEALRLLTACIDEEGSCRFGIVFKLLGDVMLAVGKYAERVLPFFEVRQDWKVEKSIDAITKAASFYMTVLRSREKDALAWYDVSVAFLTKFKREKDPEILTKVQKMLEHALTLTASEPVLSSIWTMIAETKRLSDSSPRHQLHCLSRALTLNKANDAAWLSLAVLCLQIGKMNTATRLLEQAIKYNPHNAEAWCAWAQHAHLAGVSHDALAMFRQALCIRPTVAAAVGYSTYLCDSLKQRNCRFDSATAALDFEPVIDLRDLECAKDHILYHLGTLADLFGYYSESFECFNLCQKQFTSEIQRVNIKLNVICPETAQEVPSPLLPGNDRLAGMLSFSVPDCLVFLLSEVPVYAELFDFIEKNDPVAFRNLYMKCVKGISVPLFIAALITSNTNLPVEFVRTIHEALPRHELIDYFPTVLPDEMDNGLRHLEQDGEEPFRYRHRVAHGLLEQLKILREKHMEQKMLESEPPESGIVIVN